MKVCFIGHRFIKNEQEIKTKIENVLCSLVEKGADTFFFGSKSKFNSLCLECVTKLKAEYPHIQRIYVRAEFQHIDKDYENYLLESYDSTYFPAKIENAGRSAYVERNQEMIDNSDICVFYFDNAYTVPPLKNKKTRLPDKMRSSGTKTAFKYATSKKKEIINLYTEN